MNKRILDRIILTLVTFMPAMAGAALLLIIPRRDRDIRVFALVVSLLMFGCLSHLAAYFQRHVAGLSIRESTSVDLYAKHSLPHGRGRHLDVAGPA